MITKDFVVNSLEELKNEIRSITQDFRPTLGILFCSLKHDLAAISKTFDDADIDLLGCSSAGEIMNENIYSSSIVCILTNMKKENYHIISEETNDDTYQTAFNIGNAAKSIFENPAMLIVSGGVAIDGEKIVLGIKDGVQRDIPIFGGLAGDDIQQDKTYAISRFGQTQNGLTALVLNSDKVEVQGLATSGWEAIGTVHTITKAKDNVVYTIDNQPALDVFLRHFGYFDNVNLEGDAINKMSTQYPLQIQRDGDYSVLRSPLFRTEDKTLILAGGVKEGDKFRFSISPGFEVIDKTVEEYSVLQKEKPEADLMILFSCVGRHAALGPMIEDEVSGISSKWDAPLIGLFTYGEIGSVKNKPSDFHNETCSMVLLKEK
jgi:hypothetical protein